MTDGLNIRIDGLEPLRAKLKSVSDDVQFKGGRFALRKAANIIVEAAKANADRLDDPSSSEKISKNITVRWSARTFKRTGNLKFRVGVLGGARDYSAYGEFTTGKTASANPGGDTFYWRFLEFGTAKMRAQPFMAMAMSENVQNATDEFVKQYGKALDRAIKRVKK